LSHWVLGAGELSSTCEEEDNVKGLGAFCGVAMFVFFGLFVISIRGLKIPEIHYPFITDVCGYGMCTAASLCAVIAVLNWIDSRAEK